MKKLLTLITLLVMALFAFGCTPHMARAALFTGAVVGTAVAAGAVAHHHAHYHHYNCGCPRHYRAGRWVYYYEGSYEYYDPNAGVWYRY